MINLEYNLKHGKTTIKATIIESTVEGVEQLFRQLNERFATAEPAAATGKKTPAATTATEAPAGGENVVNIDSAKAAPEKAPAGSARNGNRKFAQQAVDLNDTAILWSNRMAVALPGFANKGPQEIVQQLNFNKALALMNVEELQSVIKLIRDTMTQFAGNNMAVESFLKIAGVIDGLQDGTEDEWQVNRQVIRDAEWTMLSQPGNVHMLNHLKSFKESRQQLLQTAAAAASCAAG